MLGNVLAVVGILVGVVGLLWGWRNHQSVVQELQRLRRQNEQLSDGLRRHSIVWPAWLLALGATVAIIAGHCT